MIESAFRDATKNIQRRAYTAARDAVIWLTAKTDWTRRRDVPSPPPELRREFPFSFEWCCRLLDLNPDELREHGIPRFTGLSHRFTNSHLPGIRGIYEHWASRTEAPVLLKVSSSGHIIHSLKSVGIT